MSKKAYHDSPGPPRRARRGCGEKTRRQAGKVVRPDVGETDTRPHRSLFRSQVTSTSCETCTGPARSALYCAAGAGYNAGVSPSSIAYETVESQVLRGNALNDPAVRQLPIYLPPGYERDRRHYPVVYVLAAYTGCGRKLLNWEAWEENLQQRMDRLIAEGRSRPMILALPDCFTRYGGSQYLNSTATGRYQDYLLEVVHWVDARFRTLADRDHRAVAGESSGGFGALTAAMLHPETFGLVGDLSGDKFFEACYARDLLAIPDLVARLDVPAILADPAALHPKGDSFHALMSAAAMSACYSPNPDAPLGFDWPVDPFTGERLPDVWSRWKAHDPIECVAPCAETLRSLRLLYFDCGEHDEYSLHLGTRLIAKRLSELGIRFRRESFDGGHRDLKHRYDLFLSAFSAAMPT